MGSGPSRSNQILELEMLKLRGRRRSSLEKESGRKRARFPYRRHLPDFYLLLRSPLYSSRATVPEREPGPVRLSSPTASFLHQRVPPSPPSSSSSPPSLLPPSFQPSPDPLETSEPPSLFKSPKLDSTSSSSEGTLPNSQRSQSSSVRSSLSSLPPFLLLSLRA